MTEFTNFFLKNWILIVILGHFLGALSSVLSKIIVSGSANRNPIEPAPYAFYSGFFGIVFFLPALILNIWLDFVSLSLLAAYIGIIAGTIWILSLRPLYHVLTRHEASRVITIYAAALSLFTFIVTYSFLGERLNNIQLFAVALLISGGILASMRQYENGGLGLKDIGLTVLAGSGIALGLVLLGISYGLQGFSTNWQNFLSGFTWLTGGYFLASVIFYLWPGQKDKILSADMKPSWKLFFSEKVLGTSGSIFIKYAISLMSATLVNAFEGTKQLFVLILAGIFSFFYPGVYKEELKGVVLWQKIIAAALVFSGIYLLIRNS
jgi:drug/metabolite transporter (DMT)-like permease